MLKLYVGAVVALAAAVAGVATSTVPAAHHPSLGVVALLAALVCLTEYMEVRHYHYRGHGASLNLIEGVMAPAIYASSGLEVTAICVIGLGVAETIRRGGLMKALFNMAQWTLAASSAALVLHAMSPDASGAGRVIVAIAITVMTMSLVNHVAVGLVLMLAVRAARESQSRKQALDGFRNRVISNAAAMVTGLTLVAAYRWSPYLVVLGAVYVFGLDAAGRAHASVTADHRRLEGLQRATHALAMSLNVNDALPEFLAEMQRGFEVREAVISLFGDSPSVHRVEDGGYRVSRDPDMLAESLRSLQAPRHLSEQDEPAIAIALRQSGHARALAVPLSRGAACVGVLMLFDRIGVEGFEAGEQAVASALARELVSFLERVELVQAIDEERRKLTDIVESTSDGILTIDATGVITSWNRGFAEMTGYSADEMVGTRHFGLLRARDANGRDVIIERWLGDDAVTTELPAELQVFTATGQTVWLSCSYSRIEAPQGHHGDALVVVGRNVTQARELERLKDDFVAVVSHELRTPLVPIKGWAQTLLNRGDRLNDHQRRTAVQAILAQAQKLESLVLNILEASRVESGRLDGEGIADVAAITMRIVEDTLAARPDREIHVRPPAVPCSVRGSAVWVERAVSNLVANAIKYSPDDEAVDVVVSAEGEAVVVSVTDRGPGIAPDAQERIFERFERLEETMKQTGTGLGLYITRRLARAMGGDVSVSSVPGAGSTFLLRLPGAPVSQQSRVPGQRTVDARNPNVVNLR
jgi:PAS domain S-box-containing protein